MKCGRASFFAHSAHFGRFGSHIAENGTSGHIFVSRPLNGISWENNRSAICRKRKLIPNYKKLWKLFWKLKNNIYICIGFENEPHRPGGFRGPKTKRVMTRKEAEALKVGQTLTLWNTIPQQKNAEFTFVGWKDENHKEAIIEAKNGHRMPWSYRRLTVKK